ncbi:AMP-binding protein [Novosphingobium sp. FGD1]|uniref:AMP-binding protein n=1 Tax=Novosphingobium silvae TaxID=2692619 RepID=A0A7X4GK92_9SPHN|nr:AMP-binding protein [Novosphingobium silvae]MYL99754.1 AMP-binding protein [Novosphingobium silvae]
MSGHPGAIAALYPERDAVIAQDGTRLSYRDLDQRSLALAQHLHASGLAVGDAVALLIGNRLDFFVAAWAAQRSGLYFIPIATRLTPLELAYIFDDSAARALILDPMLIGPAEQALAFMEGPKPLVLTLDPVPGHEAVPLVVDPAQPLPEAIEGGDMLYTSGTTGRPKAVRRSLDFGPLGSDLRRAARAAELFGMDADSIFLSPAPLYHAAPLRFAMGQHRSGGSVVMMFKFGAEQALELIEREKVTHSQWVPTMFARLLDLPSEIRSRYDLSTHRIAIHAGAPCPPDVKRAMIAWWGPILHEYYSGTEGVGFTHTSSADWLARPGTVGRAYGCKIHIVDDDGTELAAGQTGNVYFEGRSGLVYHNAPEKTREAHHAAGWATFGDIGHVDDDGFLFLSDRRSFTIVSGGVNIYPAEIEAALATHPAIYDATAFGVPDPDLGETVQAVVQLRDGLGSAELAQDILAFLRERLAPFKLPKFLGFREELPRTETGKLMKHKIRDEYIEESGRGFNLRELGPRP